MNVSHLSRKKCIFCESSKMSFEHFWPRWLGKQFPHMQIGTHAASSMNEKGEIENRRAYKGILKKKKDLKIKLVCVDCNNGWMSQIETAGKMEFESFPNINRVNLAAWLVLRTIIIEFVDPKTSAIDKIMHNNFYENKLPDTKWAMYIAKIDNFYDLTFNHLFGTTTNNKVQITGFFIMNYFLLNISATADLSEMEYLKKEFKKNLLEFWPTVLGTIIPTISLAKANELCNSLARDQNWIRNSWDTYFKVGDEPIPPQRQRKTK